jgi:hexosaminidase
MNKIHLNTLPKNEKLEEAISLIKTDHDLDVLHEQRDITFIQSTSIVGYEVQHDNGQWTVTHHGMKEALRAYSTVLSGIENEIGATPFEKFGIMLDCSRNGVMKMSPLKRWLRQLALLGYNQVMLYTEDTYKLADEPYFGYLRGGYSLDDVKEMDAYAQVLGIEIVACIQTLGHLSQLLKWKAYQHIKDTERVLMIDDDQSYALIEKMVHFWKEGLSSDRIHVGMDETHDLGRGRFLDKFGYEDGFDLFNRHLRKVIQICKDSELNPMIWSDMYFRLGSKTQDYYDKDLVIPEHVIKDIPSEAELVYWDYYSKDQSFYSEWIQKHRVLNKEPIMASGVWTWSKFWYDHQQTISTAGPCIKACRKENVKEFILTMWGDDGAYCDFDSAFTGLTWAAEQAYHVEANESSLRKRFSTLFGDDFDNNVVISDMYSEKYPAQALLWDDPILSIFCKDLRSRDQYHLNDAIEHFSHVQAKSASSSSGGLAGDHDHGRQVIATLLAKLECSKILLDISEHKDWKQWQDPSLQIQPKISEVILHYKKLALSFRKRWNETFKPYGLEVLQIRLAGLVARYEELLLRIEEIDLNNPKANEELFQDLIERLVTTEGDLPYPHYIFVASSSLCISRPV